jgi:hypothetical protein
VFRRDKEYVINVRNMTKSFGNEAVVSSSSEYDISKKEDLDSLEIEQTHFVSS